jgi:hypothetical protein
LLISQQLMDHRVNPIPIPGHHLVERGLVTALEAINKGSVEGNFLGFGRHTFCLALMIVMVKCSHDLSPICCGYHVAAAGQWLHTTAGGEISCKPST